MADNYVVNSTVAPSKWTKKYKRYRAGRSRLYMCMVSLMLFISLSVVCTALLFKNSFYLQPSEYELKNDDMRKVDVSTLFCEGIILKKANFNRRITVVPQVKRYNAAKQSISSDVVLLRRDRYWYRSFYLLKGSIVVMRLSSRHSVSVYWLNGRGTLDKWTGEMNKALKQSFKIKTEKFTGTSMHDTFTIRDDNNYYLGFTSTAGDTEYTEVLVNMTISRVIYDTSSYTEFCNASTGKSCHVQLRFNSDDTAVIEVDDITINTHDIWTIWYCQPRIWIYAAIFGGIFLVGNIVLFLIYVCVLSKVNKKVPNQKPSEIPSRTESFNMHAVKLRSINTTEIPSNNIGENSQGTLDNHRDEHRSEECVNDAGTTIVVVRSINKPEVTISEPWRTPPSPRWSTFLQDHPFDEYEESVTNFNQSTGTDGSASTSDQNLTNINGKESCFANELAEHLKRLETVNIVYVGPEETDIDDLYGDEIDYPDSELEPFFNDVNDRNIKDFLEVEQQEVVKRREGRREQRWEPRLSMVTEV